jgi:hypothetical protein
MTDRISESGWKRDLDKLAGMLVEKGGTMTWTAAYRAFSSDLRPREFLDRVQALEESGRLIITTEKKRGKILHSTEL